MKTTYAAERRIDAPVDVVYRCLADYHTHHRPGGFLPPAFSDLEIHAGGVGDGTRVSWFVDLGGRRRFVDAVISEPVPGRTLVETAAGLVTTFTVEPDGAGCRVRFTTVLDATGVDGVLSRLFAPRLLRPIYDAELANLAEYARALMPAAA